MRRNRPFTRAPALERAPSGDRLLLEIRERPQQPLTRRELVVELLVGGGFLAAAAILA